ncbi:MAG: glycerol-3-phosphate acyltransferase [Acidobacteria bacterium]|nr:glycerol-3-phosphate acyltransferase [Acidobacteriota bacterium]
MTLGLKFLLSFLIGSIPFAKIAMLGTGIDIKKVGSGNPGFRNVARVASRWRSGFCLAGDLGKGYAALFLLGRAGTSAAALWGAGIASVMGHCWSPFLRFNGGKGVATTFGVLLYLEPYLTLACLPLYPALRFIGTKQHWKQEGAIASLSTALVISAAVLVFKGFEPGIFACFLLAIVTVRHAPNLRDLL